MSGETKDALGITSETIHLLIVPDEKHQSIWLFQILIACWIELLWSVGLKPAILKATFNKNFVYCSSVHLERSSYSLTHTLMFPFLKGISGRDQACESGWFLLRSHSPRPLQESRSTPAEFGAGGTWAGSWISIETNGSYRVVLSWMFCSARISLSGVIHFDCTKQLDLTQLICLCFSSVVSLTTQEINHQFPWRDLQGESYRS